MAEELIHMTPRELSRYETIKNLIEGVINGSEAAKQIGLSTRQVKNIKARVLKEGPRGVTHRSRGKEGNRRICAGVIDKAKHYLRTYYYDFGPTFAAEKLREEHQIKLIKEKARQLMTDINLWKPKSRKKNKEYRAWRPRKEQFGEMEQFDGSYHNWFEERTEQCCLLASIDDASGRITQLKFVHWEGVREAFSFWQEYFTVYGKPLSIYLDRHSTYKQNQKSVFDDPQCLTQFQRAMEQDLNIKVIHAYSPQAKGRIERLFGTLQDRLIKEMRLAGIRTIKEANKFAKGVFVPKFNAKYAVLPQKKGNLHRALTKSEKSELERIFSIQTKRVVSNDFTVRHQGKWYQLGETQPTTVYRKDKVLVEERIGGQLFISLRSKYLNFRVLPSRPKKVKTKVIALVRSKPDWKPPLNHPWRRPFIFNHLKRCETSSLMRNNS